MFGLSLFIIVYYEELQTAFFWNCPASWTSLLYLAPCVHACQRPYSPALELVILFTVNTILGQLEICHDIYLVRFLSLRLGQIIWVIGIHMVCSVFEYLNALCHFKFPLSSCVYIFKKLSQLHVETTSFLTEGLHYKLGALVWEKPIKLHYGKCRILCCINCDYSFFFFFF